MREPGAMERWRSEKTAAYLSRIVAEAEAHAGFRKLFNEMADAAEEQAGLIAKGFERTPRFAPSLRARAVAWIVNAMGPRAARPILAAAKVRGVSVYDPPPAQPGHPMPTSVEEVGARHKGVGGGTLRAAVFGVNDGLVSNTGLVMGVAGATQDPNTIVVAGAAGLLAGAFSMGAGEYISVRSQREMYEYQIAQEREELKLYPEEEAEELALIYHARGVPLDDARAFASELIKNPDVALDALAREELGLDPDNLGSAWGAAIYSFFSFAFGATLPLLPFAIGMGDTAILAAAALAGVSLFAVGALISLFTGRNTLLSGARMTAIGAFAGVATYAIGALFGVATG